MVSREVLARLAQAVVLTANGGLGSRLKNELVSAAVAEFIRGLEAGGVGDEAVGIDEVDEFLDYLGVEQAFERIPLDDLLTAIHDNGIAVYTGSGWGTLLSVTDWCCEAGQGEEFAKELRQLFKKYCKERAED